MKEVLQPQLVISMVTMVRWRLPDQLMDTRPTMERLMDLLMEWT